MSDSSPMSRDEAITLLGEEIKLLDGQASFCAADGRVEMFALATSKTRRAAAIRLALRALEGPTALMKPTGDDISGIIADLVELEEIEAANALYRHPVIVELCWWQLEHRRLSDSGTETE